MRQRQLKAFSAAPPPAPVPAELQETQYGFPYHYLPQITVDGFRQHQHWSWGYRYLGRLEVALNLLAEVEFHSLLDIGCGDGRFLKEIHTLYPKARLLGIDPSLRAISLAKQMNPNLAFEQCDINSFGEKGTWDAISLLDVIEHIAIGELNDFIKTASRLLKPGGHLILTVPSRNEKLSPKHYQHFTARQLQNLVKGEFEIIACIPFDKKSTLLNLATKLMGGSGRYYVITHQRINNWLFEYYLRNHLYPNSAKNCLRIALKAVVKRSLP